MIQPFIDYLIISIIEQLKSNSSISDNHGVGVNNIIPDKKKANKKKIVHSMMKYVNALLVIERILLGRYVGVSYSNYGKKSMVG